MDINKHLEYIDRFSKSNVVDEPLLQKIKDETKYYITDIWIKFSILPKNIYQTVNGSVGIVYDFEFYKFKKLRLFIEIFEEGEAIFCVTRNKKYLHIGDISYPGKLGFYIDKMINRKSIWN